MRVLRTAGVETEVDLAFAGLHQLVRPVLDLADRLPAPQAQALLGAFGLIDHGSEDRFLVAAAALSLLSEAAEDGPVLCVVEDAHWLDRPSVEALTFAARRLDAEGVVIVVATRDETWAGLPELRVGGLRPADATALLREHVENLAPQVRDHLVEETGGNPLALIELAASLTPEQLADREPLPATLPLTGRVQEAFLGQVRLLPEASQRLMLVAAADDTGEPAVIFRAAESLGVGPDALEAAERAGLVEVDGTGRLAFRHPLVRAAVYQGATFMGRVAAHRALAAALDDEVHVERRVWHLAAAATGPDETIARDLERAGALAQRRGGYAVAGAAFERAAELSPAHPDRARLVAAAAQAAYQAGQMDRAAVLADQAESLIDDPVTAAEVSALRGRIAFARGSSVTAHDLLVTASRRVPDPHDRAALLIEAARAAWNINDADRVTVTTEALIAIRLAPGDPLGPLISATIGHSDLMAGRVADAVARIREGVDGRADASADVAADLAGDLETWVTHGGFALVTGDDTAALRLAASAVAQCRTRGLAVRLPWALTNQAMAEQHASRHAAALVSASEGLRLARDLGQEAAVCRCESVLAWAAALRGEEDRCRELAEDTARLADKYQLATIAMVATRALALLDLSLGRHEQAVDRILGQIRGPGANPFSNIMIVPDLVEAAARAGRTDDLGESLAEFERWADATAQLWARAVSHRCRALVAGGEEDFGAAIRLHQQAGQRDRPFERARTQLLYGEWLRRARRRADSRTHLMAAYETFERLGATPWADRASAELRASGATVRQRGAATTRLTPQESQVVRLAAEGGTNREIAAQLFLSPRTVAYHLYKAFPKLGVTSRTDLARLDLERFDTAE
jgi:DNA-binding CsgD family transcriptional regulator/tetratricopeptide (TPR) repeat protein